MIQVFRERIDFILLFEDNAVRNRQTRYFLPTIEIKDYNVMMNGKNFFHHSVKNNWRTCYNILRIATAQRDDYITRCFLDDNCFKKHYRLIAIDLSKQQALDADPKLIQKIIFTGNLGQDGNRTMFFITEETKETILDLSQETERLL